MKTNTIYRAVCIAWVCLMVAGVSAVYAQRAVGTTPDRATRIADTTLIAVQSGGNYIRIEPENLPVTVTYMPGSEFGPVPMAMVMSETLPVQVSFEDCKTVWRWQLEKSENAQIIEVRAHESATAVVAPHVCRQTSSDTTALACGAFEWRGRLFEQTGDYYDTLVNAEGCDSIRTLHLTVFDASANNDTVVEVWDSITWEGTKYTTSGSWPVTKKTDSGCDYTYTLILTVHHTSYETETIHGCDSLEFRGQVYTHDDRVPGDTVMLENGDRKVMTYKLTVGKNAYLEMPDTSVCVAYVLPYSGREVKTSGPYNDTVPKPDGCDSIITFNLIINPDCSTYETVYFCPGYSIERNDTVSPGYVRLYREYEYQSPAEWDYMEGVILQREADSTLVDLMRAQTNLEEHYTGSLSPVTTVAWSFLPDGDSDYRALKAKEQPQWIAPGVVVMTVRFLCGQTYSTDFETAVERVADGKAGKGTKVLIDGQIVIIRNGVKYNLLGNKVK